MQNSGYFAGKIEPVLCLACKVKYICWVTFYLLNGHYRRKTAKILLTLDNLRKFSQIMDVRDETHTIHSCYAA